MNTRFLSSTARATTFVAGLGLAAVLTGCTRGGAPTGGSTGAPTGGVIATVGGVPIEGTTLASALEVQYGQATLADLIVNQLVANEAKSKGVTVTDAEVDADLKRRTETDAALAKQLQKRGAAVDFVKGQVRRELDLAGLLTRSIKFKSPQAEDAALKTFFARYQAFYARPAYLRVAMVASSSKPRAEAMRRALLDKSRTVEQLVQEQKQKALGKSDLMGGISYPAGEAFALAMNYPPAIASLPKGGVSAIVTKKSGPDSAHALFVVVDKKAAVDPDLKTQRAVVLLDYKLAQIAKGMVSNAPRTPPFDQTLAQAAIYLTQKSGDPNYAPTLRGVLSLILREPMQGLVQSLQTQGTVNITDSKYTNLASQYQPLPTQTPPTGARSAGATSAATVAR